MESEGIGLKQRGAKRKRKDVLSVEMDGDVTMRSIETRSKSLLARKDVEGTGVVLGKVMECDKRVIYHDGSCEYMGNKKLKQIRFKDSALEAKIKELDESISKKCAKDRTVKFVPPPILPPSTGNIGLPEECIADLLTVYTFLRSFSIPLCLSPFVLKDFVGSLICSVQSTLLDSIHVALMHCLQRHFETLEALKSDGSELASKYLRSVDWSLIDLLTWPVSLVQYLMISKCTKGKRWKEFYSNALQKEYHALSVCSKLTVLRKLCDDALDSEEIRLEIDMLKESAVIAGEKVPAPTVRIRRVIPGLSKTSACDDPEAMDSINKHKKRSSCDSNSWSYESNDQDGNAFECCLCGMDGTLLCCDGCPSAFHHRCVGVSIRSLPEGKWYCPECTINRIDPRISKEMCRRGAEIFGVDPYEQVFLGTCNHLLVMKMLVDSDLCIRYYHQNDIPTVVHTLHSSVQHNSMYAGLCEAIQHYWKIPMDVQSITETPTNAASKKEDGECLAPAPVFFGEKSFDISQLPENEKVACSITDFNSANMVDSLEKSKCTKEQAFRLTSQQVDPFDLAHQMLGGKSKLIQSAFCTSKNISSGDTVDIPKYTWTSLKARDYINHYSHGDYAASASASLVKLIDNFSAKRQYSELYIKTLQSKAFSSASIWCFWPDPENKLVEVPKQRCNWCLNCKPSEKKKGCLLNAAVSNAIRGTMKKKSATRPLKNGERSLYSIVTYMLNLEESLHSLTFGPFQSPGYRKTWRKQVEQTITCSQIKSLLLELEKNIRLVAFKREWIKLVDEWSVASAVNQYPEYSVGSSKKRGPGGRRSRNQGIIPEVTSNNGQDKSKDFIWWRGGIVSKLIFHRGILPCSIAKKSAREGRSRKLPIVTYVEGVEVPKRTQQFIWRAAVEMSKNMSQLAMQIRYLDSQVRWGDLDRPEEDTMGGKGSETQASLFRNAIICKKHYAESQIQYAVDFRSQKHLPLRLTKNAVEVEKTEAGNQLYWFLETSLPLYLIRDYEKEMENREKVPSQPAVNELSELQKRQLKASRKDIFSYLLRRRDNLENCHCASCQLDLLIGNAVKCARCKGYCHTQCMVSSTPNMNEEVKFFETCKRCYEIEVEVVAIEENHYVANTSCLQFKETQNALSVTKNTPTSCSQNEKPQNTPTVCNGGNKRDSVMNQAPNHSFEKPTRKGSNAKSESRSKLCSWGLIWNNKSKGTGFDFRLKNILLKGNPNSSHVTCDLCKKAYNKDFMYISCETCNRWYHADALELDESRLFELSGFKCCKCRRIKSPICPYTDPDPVKKPAFEGRDMRRIAAKHGSLGVDKQLVCIEGANPFGSLSRVEHLTDKQTPEININSFPGSRNMSVGGHLMQNNYMVHLPEYNYSVDLSANFAENSLLPAVESLSCKGLNISRNDLDDGVMSGNEGLNCDDMEFEPRNYVSCTEFGTSDDGQKHLDEVDQSGSITKNLKKSYSLSSDGKVARYGASTCQQECPDSLAPSVCVVQCRICFLAQPSPDRCCEICRQWMHSHCSPVEESSEQGPWMCVNCREWQ